MQIGNRNAFMEDSPESWLQGRCSGHPARGYLHNQLGLCPSLPLNSVPFRSPISLWLPGRNMLCISRVTFWNNKAWLQRSNSFFLKNNVIIKVIKKVESSSALIANIYMFLCYLQNLKYSQITPTLNFFWFSLYEISKKWIIKAVT